MGQINNLFSKQAILKCKACGAHLSIGFRPDDREWYLYCSNIANCHHTPFIHAKNLESVIEKYLETCKDGLPNIWEIDDKYSHWKGLIENGQNNIQ